MRTLIVLLATLVLAGCASTRPAEPGPDDTLNAALWVQTSAEYDALAQLVYTAAGAHLSEAIADASWTALPETPAGADGPPAIILDVDETVLDNVAYQARMIERGSGFDPVAWASWVNEAQAPAVPGAAAFLQRAAEAGATIFYVTNRDAELEPATRANLEALGLPMVEGLDAVLMRGEREGWGSDKTTRRAHVAEDYRVVMLFGDDLNDFVAARLSTEERDALVSRYADWWGTRWFVLPNPVYGSWERSLYGFESGLPVEAVRAAKQERLDPQQ